MKKYIELKLFDDKKVRALWKEDSKKRYFSFVDVNNVLTNSLVFTQSSREN